MLPAAMPLLQLLARLRTLAGEADPGALRDRTEVELRSFESRAVAAGIPPDQVRRAQYGLCESLDDAVLNTPWGAASPWATHPMVASLHPDIGPGRFFDALRQAEAKAATLRPVLEILVLCLSLGMTGRYRTRPGSGTELEALRTAAVATLMQHTPAAPAELAADWKGVDAPARRRGRFRLPVWVAGSAALAAAAAAFLLLDNQVNASGDALFARMLATPTAHMPALARDPAPPPPPAPAPPEPSVADRLRSRLEAAGVPVTGSPGAPALRLPERSLFASNSATLLPVGATLLATVADALRPEGGRVRVLGYADDRPVRTVPFPSAFKLTAARADAVKAALARTLDGIQITAEGRGGADPVAPNATPAGRDNNRRVEIVLEGAAP